MQGCGLENSFSHCGLAIRLAYVFVFVNVSGFVDETVFVFVYCRIPTHICLVG